MKKLIALCSFIALAGTAAPLSAQDPGNWAQTMECNKKWETTLKKETARLNSHRSYDAEPGLSHIYTQVWGIFYDVETRKCSYILMTEKKFRGKPEDKQYALRDAETGKDLTPPATVPLAEDRPTNPVLREFDAKVRAHAGTSLPFILPASKSSRPR